jgi:hypothetical protein
VTRSSIRLLRHPHLHLSGISPLMLMERRPAFVRLTTWKTLCNRYALQPAATNNNKAYYFSYGPNGLLSTLYTHTLQDEHAAKPLSFALHTVRSLTFVPSSSRSTPRYRQTTGLYATSRTLRRSLRRQRSLQLHGSLPTNPWPPKWHSYPARRSVRHLHPR